MLLLIALGALVLINANILKTYGEQHFVDLAQSFLQGKLYFLPSARWLDDVTPYRGNNYWPLGPLPAIILMPFVAIWGQEFQQGYLQFVFVALSAFLFYKIAKKTGCDQNTSLWLSAGYIFSTCFIGIAMLPWSWQFGQVTGTLFLVYAIYAYLHKKNLWLIGASVGLAVMARTNFIIAALFFVFEIFFSPSKMGEKIRSFVIFCFPLVICLLLLGSYNFFCFHNFLDSGYSSQVQGDTVSTATEKYGFWGINHIPTNFYYLFLKSPEAVYITGTMVHQFPFIRYTPWGMSILFTSPMLLWIFKAPFKNKEVLFASIASGLSLLFLLGYWGTGYSQYGYRYILDFQPFLFLMLAYTVKQMPSFLLKVVIVFSWFFNLFLLMTK